MAVIKSSSIVPFEQATAAIVEGLEADARAPTVVILDLEGAAENGAKIVAKAADARPDVVITVGSLATSAALAKPPAAAVVFSMVLYPKQSGFLKDRERVTGASLDIPPELEFRMLRRLLPSAHRLGVLYHPDETGRLIARAKTVAAENGFELVAETVDDPKHAVPAFEDLIGRVDAMWSVADSHVFNSLTTSAVILSALRGRVPLFGISPAHVRAGALAALGSDYADVGRQTAEIALRVLGGEKPGAIGIAVPRKVSIALNLRTAAHLRLQVPEDLENEASEVIR
ncbi:MAG: hypothetical protein QOD06_708 [Candidatus Binatota bacterium]|nr:hypothetical protein [Candidatus Binatota bacterium]